jgi:hypothetical protein
VSLCAGREDLGERQGMRCAAGPTTSTMNDKSSPSHDEDTMENNAWMPLSARNEHGEPNGTRHDYDHKTTTAHDVLRHYLEWC